MRNLILFTLFFLLLNATGESQQKEWLDIKSVEEDFAISFPSKPSDEKSDTRGFFHTGYHIYSVYEGKTSYSIGCYSVNTPLEPDEIERKFNYVAELLLFPTYKLVSSKSITLNGYPGREVRIEGEKNLWILRVYMTKGWMYHILTSQPKRKGESPDTIRFHESFRLLDP